MNTDHRVFFDPLMNLRSVGMRIVKNVAALFRPQQQRRGDDDRRREDHEEDSPYHARRRGHAQECT
jgi:hypothetical protein